MSTQAARILDAEQDRQRRAKVLIAERGPQWADPYEPGTLGCHELLDRTALVADTMEQFVLSHPACVQNPEWFALADQATTALRELYQRIGAEHLSAERAT